MKEISPRELKSWMESGQKFTLVDVRFEEEKKIADIGGILIPLPELERRWREIPDDEGPIVTYCHHGVRSLHAAQILIQKDLEVLSLAGGIDSWSRLIDPKIPLY